MITKENDAKAIIRELLSQDLKEVKSRTIFRDGLEIRITRNDDDSIRFDLVDQGKSYVLMSGRLYERQYNQQNAELCKPEDEPDKNETLTFTENQELPAFVEQLNYKGEVERVDTRLFKNRITCECGSVRWVKNADLFQTKCCKPCAHKKRQERRKVIKVAAECQ